MDHLYLPKKVSYSDGSSIDSPWVLLFLLGWPYCLLVRKNIAQSSKVVLARDLRIAMKDALEPGQSFSQRRQKQTVSTKVGFVDASACHGDRILPLAHPPKNDLHPACCCSFNTKVCSHCTSTSISSSSWPIPSRDPGQMVCSTVR